MSVLQMKRTTSKAEFVNTANQIYVETINFLTRISARYSRLLRLRRLEYALFGGLKCSELSKTAAASA